MSATKVHYSLSVRNTGRSISDFGWEATGPGFIAAWKSALVDLSSRRFKFNQNIYDVEANWQPMLRRHVQHQQCMRQVENRIRQLPKEFHAVRFPSQPAKAAIIVTSSDEDAHRSYAVATTFVHDVFLIMNIAAPACCDFLGATLSGMRGQIDTRSDIALSNVHFDSALEVFLRESWEGAEPLDVNTVANWYFAVRSPASQIATNPMERVLFALLHMAKLEASPMLVIWLFYAFESLLQTKVGENFSSLVNRLSLLLALNEAATKVVKKRMRLLYDIRSSFVHGGFEITHIIQSELLDKRVSERFEEIIDATNYGHALLIAAVRKVAARGWRWPKFREELDGTAI